MDSNTFAAVIGVGGSLVGGFVGALTAWGFDRSSKRRDRLISTYGEWSVACHDVLTRAHRMGVAISNKAQTDSGIIYQAAAMFYLNNEPGNIYWREYVEYVRRLEVSQFKVASISDHYDDYRYPQIVADITGKALQFDVSDSPPNVTEAMRALRRLIMSELPARFSSQGWKRATHILTGFRKWLMADIDRDAAEEKASDARPPSSPSS